jgi:hypothetical protein
MFARHLKILANAVALATTVTMSLTPRTSAQARPRLEIAPALGTYVPTGALPYGPRGTTHFGCLDTGAESCSLTERQALAVAVGGRVTSWFGNRGAIESSVWYAPAGVTGSERGPGNILMGSLRLVANLAPRATTMATYLLGGPVVIHRFGSYVADLTGTTSFGGALGICLDIHPGREFAFRAQLEDYLYSVRFEAGGEKRSQQDLVLSVSVNLFGRRERRV